MSIRAVKKLITAKPTLEEAGVHLRRAFGLGQTSDYDPFLQGIETITYLRPDRHEHAGGTPAGI